MVMLVMDYQTHIDRICFMKDLNQGASTWGFREPGEWGSEKPGSQEQGWKKSREQGAEGVI